MKSYFIRHTKKIAVSEEDIQKIFEQDKIAIHFPGEEEQDSKSIEPSDYETKNARRAIGSFKELNDNGGYIWAKYYSTDKIKIGEVQPGSFELFPTYWSGERRKPGEAGYRKIGDKAILKTLKMKNVSVLNRSEAIELARGIEPMYRTITRWRKIDNRLERRVNHAPFDQEWKSLGTQRQETTCSEYLRKPDVKQCPKLEFLLLPIGGTLEDVDIYGLTEDGKKLFAQVTYYEKSDQQCKQKIDGLRKYQGKGIRLVFFCRCENISEEKGILFIPVEKVFEWLKKRPTYFNMMVGLRA